MEMRRQYVKNIPFLRKLSDRVISEILFLMRESVYDEGSLFLKSGEISDKIYVIWRGEVHAQINYNK